MAGGEGGFPVNPVLVVGNLILGSLRGKQQRPPPPIPPGMQRVESRAEARRYQSAFKPLDAPATPPPPPKELPPTPGGGDIDYVDLPPILGGGYGVGDYGEPRPSAWEWLDWLFIPEPADPLRLVGGPGDFGDVTWEGVGSTGTVYGTTPATRSDTQDAERLIREAEILLGVFEPDIIIPQIDPTTWPVPDLPPVAETSAQKQLRKIARQAGKVVLGELAGAGQARIRAVLSSSSSSGYPDLPPPPDIVDPGASYEPVSSDFVPDAGVYPLASDFAEGCNCPPKRRCKPGPYKARKIISTRSAGGVITQKFRRVTKQRTCGKRKA